jgi:hypothetical protein
MEWFSSRAVLHGGDNFLQRVSMLKRTIDLMD